MPPRAEKKAHRIDEEEERRAERRIALNKEEEQERKMLNQDRTRTGSGPVGAAANARIPSVGASVRASGGIGATIKPVNDEEAEREEEELRAVTPQQELDAWPEPDWSSRDTEKRHGPSKPAHGTTQTSLNMWLTEAEMGRIRTGYRELFPGLRDPHYTRDLPPSERERAEKRLGLPPGAFLASRRCYLTIAEVEALRVDRDGVGDPEDRILPQHWDEKAHAKNRKLEMKLANQVATLRAARQEQGKIASVLGAAGEESG